MNKKEDKIRLYEITQSLGRSLSHKGCKEIIFFLKDDPKRHKDIIKDIHLPVATIDRSLKELVALQLIKKIPITSSKREIEQYGITQIGADLINFILSFERVISIPATQQKIIDIENQRTR